MNPLRKPTPNTDVRYVAVLSAQTPIGPILEGELYQGSSPEVAKYPAWFIPATATITERAEALAALTKPFVVASEAPDSRFRIGGPTPVDRQRVALKPIVTGSGFMAQGTVVDQDSQVVKANPKLFAKVQADSTD